MTHQKMFTHRTTCRMCDSARVPMVLQMPSCPPVDNFRFPHEPEINLPALPMDLYQCQDCGHAQLRDIVDPQILYGNYIYTTASSPDMDRHFDGYVAAVNAVKPIGAGMFIIDVGGNDGTLAAKFRASGAFAMSVDPSPRCAEIAAIKGVPTFTAYMEKPKTAATIQALYGQADIITANNVFSHADDLRGFLQNVRRLLKPDGLYVFEVQSLAALVKNKVIDYIYHEHLSHHSVAPLRQFLASESMDLFRVDRIPTKGGSLRCWAAHTGVRQVEPTIEAMIDAEYAADIYDPETYAAMMADVQKTGDELRTRLMAITAAGGKVVSYGANPTAVVLNQLFDINRYFSFIVDDNPIRHGRRSPGAKLEVRNANALLEEMPAICVISAWRQADMIIARNYEYMDRGGKFIIPQPGFGLVCT